MHVLTGLVMQLEEQAASSDTISEASRVATVDAGSVRDDTRSLSSAVAGDEEAAANGADTGKVRGGSGWQDERCDGGRTHSCVCLCISI